MNQLQPITKNGMRVLTSTQLAEAYGTDEKRISENFSRNKERYTEGKHFILLQGDELKQFKSTYPQIAEQSLRAPMLYLWTEKGAWLHAKSLNTDQAWDAYEMLIDEYYTIRENLVPLNDKQSLIAVMKLSTMTAEETEELKQVTSNHSRKIQELEFKVDEQITLTSGEQRRLQKGVTAKVYEFADNQQERSRLFRELYREIKDRFAVASYKDIKRKELQSALRYIENWIPRKVS